MAGKLALKQVAQSGAADGQVPVWDSASGKWIPGSPASSTLIKQAEIDFGSVPTRYGDFTVIDAVVTPTSRIMAVHAGNAATGRPADEAGMDWLSFNCTPGTGSFSVWARSSDGPVVGKYKLNYTVY